VRRHDRALALIFRGWLCFLAALFGVDWTAASILSLRKLFFVSGFCFILVARMSDMTE
jgi:hypothetical protein